MSIFSCSLRFHILNLFQHPPLLNPAYATAVIFGGHIIGKSSRWQYEKKAFHFGYKCALLGDYFIGPTGIACWAAYVLPMLLSFFFNGPVGDQLSQKIMDWSSPNLQDLHTHLHSRALAFHNGWEDRNVDARVNTADNPSTSNEIFVQ